MVVFDTSRFFKPGRLSVVLDAQAGSSGKGKVSSFLTKHADNVTFACNAFSAQAGHWVRDGVERFYQTLPSSTYQDKLERYLIGPGAVIDQPAFWREFHENGVPHHKVGISPNAIVLQDQDSAYERGECSLDGAVYAERSGGTMKTGSTCHGVGAAMARRLLRRPDAKLAKDCSQLRPFLCDVPGEVMFRLARGESGLLELAQGFQLSLMGRFYPHVTSRNVTVAQGFSDMMLPSRLLGNVCLNFRTYPIRINSNKYRDSKTGEHLTWAQVQARGGEVLRGNGVEIVEGNSGGWYLDQTELTWGDVTRRSGSPTPLMELTSVTKLPRRVATFSHENLLEAIRFNAPDEPFETWLSVNFANYVDHKMSGVRQRINDYDTPGGPLTFKMTEWLRAYVDPVLREPFLGTRLVLIGTGAQTDDMVQIGD